MPEGDTILRAARTLHRVLAGRTVTAFASPLSGVEAPARRHALVGSRIEGVEARGKHLLLRFSCGVSLHTHQAMTGSWHLYRSGSRWRKPSHEMRARIDAGDVTAVCFLSPVVEILTAEEEARHPSLSTLGPDLLDDGFDGSEARLRLRRRGDAAIGVALMDQGHWPASATSTSPRCSSCAVSTRSRPSPRWPTPFSIDWSARPVSRCPATSKAEPVGPRPPWPRPRCGSTGERVARAAAAAPSCDNGARERRDARRTGVPAASRAYNRGRER